MITITIDYSDADRIDEVESLLDDVRIRDVSWNGAEFDIILGEYTSIDDCDEIAGAQLLRQISDLLNR